MEKSKVFISQAMRGLSREEIEVVRNKVVEYIKEVVFPERELEIIESVFELVEGKKPLAYLADSLKLLSTADIAVFVGDISKARGCKIEHSCALAYEIPLIVDVDYEDNDGVVELSSRQYNHQTINDIKKETGISK